MQQQNRRDTKTFLDKSDTQCTIPPILFPHSQVLLTVSVVHRGQLVLLISVVIIDEHSDTCTKTKTAKKISLNALFPWLAETKHCRRYTPDYITDCETG